MLSAIKVLVKLDEKQPTSSTKTLSSALFSCVNILLIL